MYHPAGKATCCEFRPVRLQSLSTFLCAAPAEGIEKAGSKRGVNPMTQRRQAAELGVETPDSLARRQFAEAATAKKALVTTSRLSSFKKKDERSVS
jgi:hypothetical protein